MPVTVDVVIKQTGGNYTSQAKWSKQFFKLETGCFYCQVITNDVLCGSKFSKNTRDSNKVDHLTKIHKIVIPKYLIKTKKNCLQPPITQFITREECTAKNLENIILAFAHNPTMPFKVVDDPYFRRAFNCKVEGFNAARLKKELLLHAEQIQIGFMESLRAQLVSLVLDGGKDVSNNKLISVGIKTLHNMYIYDMIDTDYEELNTNFYYELIKFTIFFRFSYDFINFKNIEKLSMI